MTTESQGPDPGPEPDLLAALVSAERASMEPPADGEQKTWKRVVASVAVGGPPPLEPSSITGPAAASTAAWIKIVLGVVLSGVVGIAAYRVANAPEPAPTETTRAHSSTEAREREPVPAPSQPNSPNAPAPSADPPEPTAATPAALSPPAAVRAKVSPPKTSGAAPAGPSAPPASDLAEETRLLARARARLRAGSADDALAPLAEHARRFPQGQLTEDRMVLRAQALCESGDTASGKKQAAALRQAFPASSHLPRVKRACK